MIGNQSYYKNGKAAFLQGKPLPARPKPGTMDVADCDFRSGWRVAEINKKEHPDWSDAHILS